MLFRYDKQIVLPRQFDTDCDVLLAKKKINKWSKKEQIKLKLHNVKTRPH